MLDTKKRLAQAMRDSEREQLERKCQWLDSEIDKLVYQLYGLTAEEIKIVEGKWSIRLEMAWNSRGVFMVKAWPIHPFILFYARYDIEPII